MATIISEATLCDAVADTMREIDGLVVQSYDQLTATIPQTPLLQVYWNAYSEEPFQSTSRMRVINSTETLQMDLYARQRSEMREDVPAVLRWVNLIRQKYYEQPPVYFGVSEIDAVSMSARRTNLTYGEPNLGYAGARFTLDIRMF